MKQKRLEEKHYSEREREKKKTDTFPMDTCVIFSLHVIFSEKCIHIESDRMKSRKSFFSQLFSEVKCYMLS